MRTKEEPAWIHSLNNRSVPTLWHFAAVQEEKKAENKRGWETAKMRERKKTFASFSSDAWKNEYVHNIHQKHQTTTTELSP